MNYYSSPVTFQRGHGLGNVLSKVFRSIIPLFKNPLVRKGAERVGSAVLNTGLSSLQDKLNKGIPLRQGFQQKGINESRKLIKQLDSQLKRKQEERHDAIVPPNKRRKKKPEKHHKKKN